MSCVSSRHQALSLCGVSPIHAPWKKLLWRLKLVSSIWVPVATSQVRQSHLGNSWYVAMTSQIGRFCLGASETSWQRPKKVRLINVSVATVWWRLNVVLNVPTKMRRRWDVACQVGKLVYINDNEYHIYIYMIHRNLFDKSELSVPDEIISLRISYLKLFKAQPCCWSLHLYSSCLWYL